MRLAGESAQSRFAHLERIRKAVVFVSRGAFARGDLAGSVFDGIEKFQVFC